MIKTMNLEEFLHSTLAPGTLGTVQLRIQDTKKTTYSYTPIS